MSRRTHAMIRRDIQITESNLALARTDFEYVKRACNGFPVLIAKLEKELTVLREEERRFRDAPRREQQQWKSAGDKPEQVSALVSSKLIELATRESRF